MKKITLFILSLALMLSLSACGEKSTTGITNFDVKDISDETFYSGVTVDDLSVNVNYTDDFDASDVNVVIDDPSVISIEFRTSVNWLFDTYIDYEITGLKEGTTSFYFETSDGVIKSDEIEITVLQNVKSIMFTDTSEFTLSIEQNGATKFFEIEAYNEIEDPKEVIEYVSENPNVVTLEYAEVIPYLIDASYACDITPVGLGETYIYLQTKDGKIQSEKIKITVEESKIEETEVTEETPIDNSRTVYTTNYGNKYHYSQSCSGDSASATTENSVKGFYDPCQKCAQ